MKNFTIKNLKREFKISESQLSKTAEALTEMSPEVAGTVVNYQEDDYTVVGKWWWAQTKYLFQNTKGDYYSALLVEPKVTGNINVSVSNEPLDIQIVKMADIEYDPKNFIPTVSNTPLDKVFSKRGGIMPATNYIVIGDPGVGKSTLSIEYAAQLQKANPEKKMLFLSGEMNKFDMYEYLERFPEWKNLSTVFMNTFEDGRYKETIESLFSQGWDVIVLDSFSEVIDSVKEDTNQFTNLKFSATGAEKWLLDIFIANNLAKNDREVNTSFISIQQVTKGGNFVGSNKLKHNTTGMIELRYTKTGERTILVTKNRRGNEYNDLHFKFNETGEPIEYDIARIEREKELAAKINAEREEIMNDERKLNALFGIDDSAEVTDNEIETIEAEPIG